MHYHLPFGLSAIPEPDTIPSMLMLVLLVVCSEAFFSGAPFNHR